MSPRIVAAIFEKDGQILLVGQRGHDAPRLMWYMPGGMVEPGETLLEALRREVREETGVKELEVGRLAWVCDVHRAAAGPWYMAFAFVITAWKGEPSALGEDVYVKQTRWVPRGEVPRYIDSYPPRMVEPLTDWVHRRPARPFYYCYEVDASGDERQLWRL